MEPALLKPPFCPTPWSPPPPLPEGGVPPPPPGGEGGSRGVPPPPEKGVRDGVAGGPEKGQWPKFLGGPNSVPLRSLGDDPYGGPPLYRADRSGTPPYGPFQFQIITFLSTTVPCDLFMVILLLVALALWALFPMASAQEQPGGPK